MRPYEGPTARDLGRPDTIFGHWDATERGGAWRKLLAKGNTRSVLSTHLDDDDFVISLHSFISVDDCGDFGVSLLATVATLAEEGGAPTFRSERPFTGCDPVAFGPPT